MEIILNYEDILMPRVTIAEITVIKIDYFVLFVCM